MKTINSVFFSFVFTLGLQAQQVTTFAGDVFGGSSDGTGLTASFDLPAAVAIDSSGNLYVADQGNDKIRKISPEGLVSTLAGSGSTGSANGMGATASFNNPLGIAVDAFGNVYVADQQNNKIRKISPTGAVSTFAGSGSIGNLDGTSTMASFNYPTGVAVDVSGNVYVADYNNNSIRKITSAGAVSTFAGNGFKGSADGSGLTASFYAPSDVAVDASGYVYVADAGNNKIRKISPGGLVSTLAGSGSAGSADGMKDAASFFIPSGLAVDVSGNVYVSDKLNHKIRKISSAGMVSTLAGSGAIGSVDGVGIAATFFAPGDIVIDASDNVFVADAANNKIRKITQSPTGLLDNNYAKGGLSVFPNPNNGVFTISISKEETFNLLNSLGQTMQTIKFNKDNDDSVHISDIDNGVYFLRSNANPTLSYRIIVTK